MLIELLSYDNSLSFNIKLAHMIGLQGAVYIAILIEINSKAYRKGVLEDDYFIVDRSWVTDKTTISEVEQLKLDQALSKLKLLNINETSLNKIKLNIDTIASFVTAEDIKQNDVKQIVNNNMNTKSSIEVEISKLKQAITATNAELRDAYAHWIETVVNKNGWLSRQSVIAAQQIVDSYSNHNLDTALKIIHTADINGYRDMQWALKNMTTISNSSNSTMIKISDDTKKYLNTNYTPETIEFIFKQITNYCADKHITYNDTNVLAWFKRSEDNGIITKIHKKPQMTSIL